MSDASGCGNCGQVVAGPAQKFCPACGQPTPAHRIDWHFMLHEFEHSVLHMDRGILYSLKELMLRPGHLMRDYLEGRRARQAKPFLLLMVMAAVVVFLGKVLLDGNVVDTVVQTSNLPTNASADEQAAQAAVLQAQSTIQGWMNRNFALVTLSLIPGGALVFRLAFIGAARLNYPEWLVVSAFLAVQTFVFWGLAIPLQRWFPQAVAVAIGLAVCYAVYSLAQLFVGYPRWKSVLRALVGMGAYFLVTVLLSVVAGVVLAISLVR